MQVCSLRPRLEETSAPVRELRAVPPRSVEHLQEDRGSFWGCLGSVCRSSGIEGGGRGGRNFAAFSQELQEAIRRFRNVVVVAFSLHALMRRRRNCIHAA